MKGGIRGKGKRLLLPVVEYQLRGDVMKMKVTIRIFAVFLLTAFLFNSVSFADNPIFKHEFTGDPSAMVYNGVAYLYTGVDESPVSQGGFVMNRWKVASSTDMVNWTEYPTPLSVSDFSWAKGDAWAGDVIHRNGKFYWFICAEHKTIPGKAIGVAVSNSPTGPFTDALGYALITNDMTPGHGVWDDIDPDVFIDDDGQAHLYWGNTWLYYAKLNADMLSLNGPIQHVQLTQEAFGPSFTEAAHLHKRNGIYYLTYASGWPEWISYSTSNSPAGPWTYRGVIQPPTPNTTTIHQTIIELNGKNYFISHNGALPTGGSSRRSVTIEQFNYNPDGTIPTILQTSTGVDGIKNRIQSFNFPDRYVRHQSFDARIDAIVEPWMDQYWQVVPGLANSGSDYVSLQSVYFPGYYLRHNNFDFVLEKHDGTEQFKADATFRKVPGLGDPSWTSFQSYNFPDRYIRHFDYQLKLDPISTAVERQDATFRIVN